MHKVISPLKVAKSKFKWWILNLNNYRNTHYQSLNKTKINYKESIDSQIQGLPEFSKIKLTYTLYPATKRLTDISNVCSIHDKYFCDALVEAGKLPDDNYVYIPSVTYSFGEVDKDNPRVEIFIEEIYEDPKDTED